MEKVTPNLEHVPKRVYVREGGVITCREILSVHKGILSPMINEGKALFILCLSVEKAKMLMEDLYYGEYTGG